MCKPFITRLRFYFSVAAIFIVILIILMYKQQDQHIVKNIIQLRHYSERRDALPSAEDPNFSPKEKSIFFHETSCRIGLTVRQACAVEAAARAHPNREIYVLFSIPVADYELKTGCLADLLQFPNVKFLRMHITEFSKGTAVQSILLNASKQSRFHIQHTADVLKIVILNKWGGIYLDTDMIVTRLLEDLPPNLVVKETLNEVASAILAFAKDDIGNNLTNAVIKEISKEYDPSNWSTIGAMAIEKVLRFLCPKVVRSKDFLTKPIINCKGVMIFNYELFYPQYYSDIDDIFKPAPPNFDLGRPYTYHMWDVLSYNMPISKGTVYELVAKAYCPTIHTEYYYEFSGILNN